MCSRLPSRRTPLSRGPVVAPVATKTKSSGLQIAALAKEVGSLVFGASDDANLEPTIETVERARELGVSVSVPGSAQRRGQ